MSMSGGWAAAGLADMRLQFLWPALMLAGTLLVGALIISMVDRWRRRGAREEILSPSDQLAQFRQLYEQGELSEEEFDQIRAKLGGQLRRESRPIAAPAPRPVLPSPPSQAQPPPPEGGGGSSTGIRPE